MLKLVEECGLQSLFAICGYLKDSLEDSAVRGIIEEILRASQKQLRLILKQLGDALEGVNDA